MKYLFTVLLNRSIVAGFLIAAILLVRLIMKKMPRKYYVIFWGLVAVRLVIPFSLGSTFSLIPARSVIPSQVIWESNQSVPNMASGVGTDIADGAPSVKQDINTDREINGRGDAETSAEEIVTRSFMQTTVDVAAIVWIVGCAVILLRALIGWILLYRKVRIYTEEEGVRMCDYIDTPFVFGVFRARIYLPSSLSDRDRPFVIAHEAAHIRRHDQIWKLAGYILLAVYWPNPLIWLAFWLFCRDIEFACDEEVVDRLGKEERKRYANALVNSSVGHGGVAAAPVALADTSVKKRIRHILEYKKAAAWSGIVCVFCCVLLSACFLTNPEEETPALTSKETAEADFAATREATVSETVSETAGDNSTSSTDMTSPENSLFQFSVGELSGTIAKKDCLALKRKLIHCDDIFCAEPVGDLEPLTGTYTQKVKVKKAFSGNLQPGDMVFVTTSKWFFITDVNDKSMERAFVNVLKTGKDYLFFCDTEADAQKGVPVYILFEDSYIAPVFCYEDVENVIAPISGESTYVPYEQVKDNEFFACDEEALEAWLDLKKSMLEQFS